MTIKTGVDTGHNRKSFLKWLPKHALRWINCASRRNCKAIANTIKLSDYRTAEHQTNESLNQKTCISDGRIAMLTLFVSESPISKRSLLLSIALKITLPVRAEIS